MSTREAAVSTRGGESGDVLSWMGEKRAQARVRSAYDGGDTLSNSATRLIRSDLNASQIVALNFLLLPRTRSMDFPITPTKRLLTEEDRQAFLASRRYYNS